MLKAVDWPLDFNKIRRGLKKHTFGMVRKYADGRDKAHQGWDFSAFIGTSFYAIAPGTIEWVKYNHGDYGTQLLLRFMHQGETLYAFYAHLQSVWITSGEVKQGQLLGTTGESGNAKGMSAADQHLHFEIRERPSPGLGLHGRRSPYTLYHICPLTKGEIRGM